MRESIKKRNNMIIGGLLGVVAMMTVAYAVFSTQLNIGTTTTINNNWNVEITNIEAKDIVNATDNDSSYEALSATFDASLEAPGSTITYDVTVTNNGNIDAYLNEINRNIETNSDLIEVEFSGLSKGQMLYASTSEIITVKISFKDVTVERLTEKITSEITVDLLFNQQGNSDSKGDNPLTKYLVTYDSGENGGVATNDNDEYLAEGETVDLSKTASKEGYDFVGWNTNKTATSGIDSLTVEDENVTLYAIYKKDISITYTKDEGIVSIGKETDTCSMYNKDENCSITLPEITISEDTDTYDANWYLDNTIAGKPNKTYKVNQNVSLNAKSRLTPYMRHAVFTGSDNLSRDYDKSLDGFTIHMSIYMVDNINIPENAIDSWDVSEKQNGSVMAWTTQGLQYEYFDLYIGGDGGVIAPEDSSYLFNLVGKSLSGSNYRYITIEDIKALDTSRVTDMSHMFDDGSSSNYITLKAESLSNFDTSNVTNMQYMFRYTNVNSLDLSNWDTSNVTDMSRMFYQSGVKTLDLSNWDNSKVTNMSSMFMRCSAESLDLSKFDTSNVTDMSNMFYWCGYLTSLDLSSFDTSKVTDMSQMFIGCRHLTTIYVSDSFITDQVTSSSMMFNDCKSLVGSLGTVCNGYGDKIYAHIDTIDNPGYFTDKTKPKIESVNASLDNYSITTVVSASDEFSEITSYQFSLDNSTWYDNGTNSTYTFNNLEQNTTYTVYLRVVNKKGGINEYKAGTFKTAAIAKPTFTETRTGTSKKITITYPSVCTEETYTCTYSINDEADQTATLDESGKVDVPFTEEGTLVAKVIYGPNSNQVVSSSYTLIINQSIRAISGTASPIFDSDDNINSDVTIDKITTVEFRDSLDEINSISEDYKWDVSDARDSSFMAWVVKDGENSTDEENKYHLYIGSNGKVVANPNSKYLFASFTGLISADLSKLDTTNVTDMRYMFNGCSSLTNLNLNNWDTSKVTNMSYMFRNCTSLTELDLSSFDTTNVTDMRYMFGNDTSLTKIYASDKFVISSVKKLYDTNVFRECTSIVGGNGTTYDSSKTKATYARIDTADNPGYFTLKQS